MEAMRYETVFFEGLSQIEGLEKLLRVSFIKEAFVKTILKRMKLPGSD